MYQVFIAEDEPAALQHLCTIIKIKCPNFQVTGTAENGKDALEQLGELKPDILITDVKMPVMDGMSALQIIHSRWPKTQVILLSGHADMQLAVQAMSEGAFGYLMKPVDIDELLFKIEDAATQIRLEAEQG